MQTNTIELNEVKVKKAKSVSDLKKKNFKTFDFQGEWEDSFGKPETNGVWMIWGESAQGKTRFALRLAKYFAGFDKVFFDTLEERGRLSFKKAVLENNMEALGSRFSYETDTYHELCARLRKKRGPKIVFIDSLQYFRITQAQYEAMRTEFKDITFIVISHAKGDQPKGAVADAVRYDADVKIFVKDFIGNVACRFGGNKPFRIWEEGIRNREVKLT